jgi:hypothetical protein
MSKQIKLSEIRAKFPMYSDLTNDQLISGIRKKFYADIPMGEFSKRIEYDTERADPTEGMSGIGKFAAGYGKVVPDMARGIGQMIGLVDQDSVDEAKRLDAPLMKTGAGMAGNIAGNIATAIPAAAVPGAATVPGAAATGAIMGAIQPVATGESRLTNTGLGGAAGAGGVVLGRGLQAGYQGARALAEPFSETGRSQIAGRVINRFADNPGSIQGATSAPTITGARPTLAEQTGDAGLARLQDSLRAADPQLNSMIGGRLAENNAARVNALRGLTGEDGARDFAVAERAGTAGPMYNDAFNVVPDAAGLSPEQTRTMQTLMRSPAVKAAMREAKAIGANKGTNVGASNATGSIEGLHHMSR